jgi:hypothetical protein
LHNTRNTRERQDALDEHDFVGVDAEPPARCLSSWGSTVRTLSEMDGSVMRYYVENSLALTYSCELADLYQRIVSSHRFLPILQATLQMAVHHEVLLLGSLLADTAYMMSVAIPELEGSYTAYGHQASSKAMKTLRSNLSVGSAEQPLNNLHSILHLCMCAFTCGNLATARLHLQAFQTMLGVNRFEGAVFGCLLETARLYDVYVMTCAEQKPLLDREWTSLFLRGIGLVDMSIEATNAGSIWWQDEIRVTITEMTLPAEEGPHDYTKVKSNGFLLALSKEAISNTVTSLVYLYSVARTALTSCFTSRRVSTENIETAHRLNIVVLHRLTYAYFWIQEQLQSQLAVGPDDWEPHLFTKCLLLAFQISTLQLQGRLLQKAVWARCHKLCKSLWQLRQPQPVDTIEEAADSRDEKKSDQARSREQLILWMMLVVSNQLRGKVLAAVPWLNAQICQIMDILHARWDEDLSEVIKMYTFSEDEYTCLMNTMHDATSWRKRPDHPLAA